MMDWFRGVSKTEEGDASDDLLKQGDKERDAGDLTAALHFYGKALAVAGSLTARRRCGGTAASTPRCCGRGSPTPTECATTAKRATPR